MSVGRRVQEFAPYGDGGKRCVGGGVLCRLGGAYRSPRPTDAAERSVSVGAYTCPMGNPIRAERRDDALYPDMVT